MTVGGAMHARGGRVMRIVHVLHSMEVAGAEVLVHDFVSNTNPAYHQAVVTLDAIGPLGESLRARGVEVLNMGRRSGVDLALPARLAQTLRTLRPDVVHAHQYTPYFYASLATRGVWPRPALVFTEHGRHVPDVRRPKRVVYNRLALAWTTRVTAVCAYVKRLLVANEGIAPDRIEVIYNGVNPARFAEDIDPIPVRRELGFETHDKIVACVARFHPVKDHPTLLRGFALAHDRLPQARLLLVGTGEGEANLRALAGELGIADVVRFAGVRKDIPEILAASDLFAMTSLSEGTSVTLLEAMLSRKPVVVTDVGGNPEIVSRDQTGLLVARGDPAATGEAIAALLADGSRALRFGEAGRARALELFSQERMHRAWCNLYDDAVRAPAHRAA